MSELKTRIINSIIDTEGGYVDNRNDSGGKTNWGITEYVARKNGYQGDMRDLPRSTAFSIYEKKYWDALKLDEIEILSQKITEELADTGVNMGVSRAAEFLQRSLNVLNQRGQHFADLRVDGDIGSRTLNALEIYLNKRGRDGEAVLFRMLNAMQGAFYVELAERREKDETFVFGWFRTRVA